MGLYREFISFEGSLFKYSLSFSLLLALAPNLLLITILFRFAYLPMDIIMRFLIGSISDMSMGRPNQVFQFFVNRNYNITSFIMTVCMSFYLTSRSIFFSLLISVSHESIGVPKQLTRTKPAVLSMSLVLLLVLSTFMATGLGEFLLIVSAVIMLLLFVIMYRVLSFQKRNWSSSIIGTMFSTICILRLTTLFVTVVSRFTSYKDVYGPPTPLVTLLLTIYLIFCVIYLKFCLNLVCEEDYGREGALLLKSEKFFILCSELTGRIHDRS